MFSSIAILHHNCSTFLATSVSPVNTLYYPQHSSPRLQPHTTILDQEHEHAQSQSEQQQQSEPHDIADFVTYVCQDGGHSTTLTSENPVFQHPHSHQLSAHSHTHSPHYQIHQQLRNSKLATAAPSTHYHSTMLPPMLPPMARPVAIIRTSGDLAMVQSPPSSAVSQSSSLCVPKTGLVDDENRTINSMESNHSPINSDTDPNTNVDCTTLVSRTSPQPHQSPSPHVSTEDARCKMSLNSLTRIAAPMYPSTNSREYFNHFHSQSTSVSNALSRLKCMGICI